MAKRKGVYFTSIQSFQSRDSRLVETAEFQEIIGVIRFLPFGISSVVKMIASAGREKGKETIYNVLEYKLRGVTCPFCSHFITGNLITLSHLNCKNAASLALCPGRTG